MNTYFGLSSIFNLKYLFCQEKLFILFQTYIFKSLVSFLRLNPNPEEKKRRQIYHFNSLLTLEKIANFFSFLLTFTFLISTNFPSHFSLRICLGVLIGADPACNQGLHLHTLKFKKLH